MSLTAPYRGLVEGHTAPLARPKRGGAEEHEHSGALAGDQHPLADQRLELGGRELGLEG